MDTFTFKKDIELSEKITNLLGKSAAHSSLSEVIKLEGDHVILDYVT